MTYEEALAYIHSYKRLGSSLTLDRMHRLMVFLGNPHKRLKFVHVAGTNGKGSTAALTAAALTSAGYITGLTISPFIVDFRERMQICGQPISPQELAEAVERIRPLAEQVEGMNEFELVTAIAFDWFAQKCCDIVVAEVGLGGRFDATNVLENPLVCIITQIGLDHTELLGETIEKIAFEKAGIIKPGAHVITCPEQDPQAVAVLLERCMTEGVVLEQPNLRGAHILHMGLKGTVVRYQDMELFIPLAGGHQVKNALTAFLACQWLADHGFEGLRKNRSLEQGFASLSFPARMEVLSNHPLVLVDGAHNENGAQALAKGLDLLDGRPVTAVMGMLADKNGRGVLSSLVPLFSRLYAVTPASPRALSAEALAEAANKEKGVSLFARPMGSVRGAINLAIEWAKEEKGAVVICGSLYLASEARSLFREHKL